MCIAVARSDYPQRLPAGTARNLCGLPQRLPTHTHGYSTCSATYCKKTNLILLFDTLDANATNNQWLFKVFCNILQNHRFIWFFAHDGCKNKGTLNIFSTCSATYCKHHIFYNLVEHVGCKTKWNNMVFLDVQQHIANQHRLSNVFGIFDAKTKDHQWFFNFLA